MSQQFRLYLLTPCSREVRERGRAYAARIKKAHLIKWARFSWISQANHYGPKAADEPNACAANTKLEPL